MHKLSCKSDFYYSKFPDVIPVINTTIVKCSTTVNLSTQYHALLRITVSCSLFPLLISLSHSRDKLQVKLTFNYKLSFILQLFLSISAPLDIDGLQSVNLEAEWWNCLQICMVWKKFIPLKALYICRKTDLFWWNVPFLFHGITVIAFYRLNRWWRFAYTSRQHVWVNVKILLLTTIFLRHISLCEFLYVT